MRHLEVASINAGTSPYGHFWQSPFGCPSDTVVAGLPVPREIGILAHWKDGPFCNRARLILKSDLEAYERLQNTPNSEKATVAAQRTLETDCMTESISIPLTGAWLCANCSVVGNSSKQCPACAGAALLTLATVLNREVERPASRFRTFAEGRAA